MEPSLLTKTGTFFFTMTMVNAELVLNAVTEKLRNVLAALTKKMNSRKTKAGSFPD